MTNTSSETMYVTTGLPPADTAELTRDPGLWSLNASSEPDVGAPSVDEVTASVVRYVYAAVGAVGMIGNAVVIVVIMGSQQMRRATTNILIANQSTIDFSASFFILLGTNIRDVTQIASPLGRKFFCRLWAPNILMWGLSVSSTYNLVCITMERYVGIVHPMRHGTTCTRGNARIVMAFAWIIGLAYNTAYMVPTSPYRDGSCMPYSEWPSLLVQRAVGLLTISLQFFVPVLVIAFAYIRIVVSLRQGVTMGGTPENRQNAVRLQNMKRARINVIKTLVAVVVVFLLCWTPNQIIYTMYNLGVQIDFDSPFVHFTVISVFLNCSINPFIYAFQYDQFRNELLRRCRGPSCTLASDASSKSTSSVYAVSTDQEPGRSVQDQGCMNPTFDMKDA